MRFMTIVKATKDSEAGVMPEETLIAEMAAYHEELAKAGVRLEASGLQPSSNGWRIKCSGGTHAVFDGPFAETKELIAGYPLIQVKSKDEALEWTKRFPNPAADGREGEIEVRQLFELEDFGPSEAIERFREMGIGTKTSSRRVALSKGVMAPVDSAPGRSAWTTYISTRHRRNQWSRRSRLLPELYEHFNPMPYELAAVMEVELARQLREQGCGVWQN